MWQFKTCCVLLFVLVVAHFGCTKAPERSAFLLEMKEPLVASNISSGELKIKPVYTRDPNQPLNAMFIDAWGRTGSIELAPTSDSAFVANIAIEASGTAIVRIWDGEKSENLAVDVNSGKPSSVKMSIDPTSPPSSTMHITTSVIDDFGNVVPVSLDDIELSSSAGTISGITLDSAGRITAVLSSRSPGNSKVSARHLESGLSSQMEIQFPEIALLGPDVLVMKEGEPNLFPVNIYLHLDEAEKLRAYSMTLRTNALTRFHHLDTTVVHERLGLTTAVPEGSTVTLTGGPFTELFDPSGEPIYIGQIWLECLGEGESAINVIAAEYTVSSSPERNRSGNQQLWQRRGCVNKRHVKKLCINPIVLDQSWTNAEILRELQHTQDNLDEACCAITIEINGVPLDQVTPNTLNPRVINGVRNNEGYPDDPGSVLDMRQNLTPEIERFFQQNAAARQANCLNVYFARSIFRFMARHIDRQGNVVRQFEVNGFPGTTITGRRLGTDGENPVDISMRDSQGRPIGNGSPLSFDDIRSIFVSHRNGATTLATKHEIGHALGLRHPSEYNQQSRIRRGGNRVMEQGENKGTKFTAVECEKIMTNLSGLLQNY